MDSSSWSYLMPASPTSGKQQWPKSWDFVYLVLPWPGKRVSGSWEGLGQVWTTNVYADSRYVSIINCAPNPLIPGRGSRNIPTWNNELKFWTLNEGKEKQQKGSPTKAAAPSFAYTSPALPPKRRRRTPKHQSTAKPPRRRRRTQRAQPRQEGQGVNKNKPAPHAKRREENQVEVAGSERIEMTMSDMAARQKY